MLKDLTKKYFFEQGFNCAETVLRAGNEYYGLGLHENDMRVVSAFGGGIQTGNTCGALLSAAALLSMKFVETKAHESSTIKPAVTELVAKITEKYGAIDCNTIKPQTFKPEVRCQAAVDTICDVIEEVVARYSEGL